MKNKQIGRDIEVCIADDQHFVRDAMVTLVETFPRVKEVYAVEDGVQLMYSLQTQRPDIVLMDVRMPNMDGVEASEKILNEYPEVKILILTMNEEGPVIVKLLELGVHGYITKSANVDSVERAIYQVMDKGYYFDDNVSRTLVTNMRVENFLRPKSLKDQIKLTQLTEREIEIVKLICEELDNVEISQKLCISMKTLAAHKQNIFKKTGTKSAISLFRLAFKAGIVAP
jgi:DNA-binding NarL/FixJ family response regulator